MEELKRIASFSVDHRKIGKGVYISRVDGDVITYDVRMVVPNGGGYLENAALHTFEHLFATYVRNSPYSDKIVYVGPMGCRTGFYFLTRDTMSGEETLALLRETMRFIASFSAPIPGASEPECGNWKDHNPAGANAYGADFAQVLEGWSPQKLHYPQ